MQALLGRVALATKRPAASGKRYAPAGKGPQAVWVRYRGAAIAGGVVLGLAATAMLVMLIVSWLRPAGLPLTITRPANGTISAPGIRCGTRGNDCAINRPKDENIELSPEPDAGYAFVGYTGDCAPGGRTVMSTARTCGATFEAITETAPPPTRLLTISPVPAGGTIEGLDILCGAKGTACSANHPERVLVDLIATPDKGFTFMGFLGDCSPLGKTQMDGPRTCSAKFAPEALASAPPAVPPKPVAPVGGVPKGGRGTVPATGTATGSGATTTAAGRDSTQRPPAGASPSPTTEQPPATPADKPVEPPISREQFAKNQIQDLLKQFCAAHTSLNPDEVQRLYPTVNMEALRRQLNTSMYKSVQCTVKQPPEFLALDPLAGTAKIEAELTRIWEHTVNKPETTAHIATMTLSRPAERTRWQIESATYRLKPK